MPPRLCSKTMMVEKPVLTKTVHIEVSKKPRFGYILLLLRITGFYFEWPKSGAMKFLYILFPTFMLGIALYKTFFLIVYLITKQEYDHIYAWIFMILIISLKATFSMIFLIYWQYRNFHTGLLDNISEFNQKYDNVKITRYNRIIFGGAIIALTGCVFCGTVSTILANNEEHYERDIIKAQQIFRVSFSPLLSILFSCYGFLVWFVVLTYYAVVTNVLSGGLEQFNQILNLKLQRANENNIEKIITENYMTHLKIIENVHMANNVFEVYTFVMFSLNIPLTMLSIISTFLGLKAYWASALFTVPTLFLSSTELSYLTIFSAKIRSNIRSIQKILFGAPAIWSPYNEKTYQIANAFVNHVNQDDLGISLWGFTTISNRLILTTLSLTITYLALLVQMRGIN